MFSLLLKELIFDTYLSSVISWLGDQENEISDFASAPWSLPCVAMTTVYKYIRRYLALLNMPKNI